jgi:hypothetical protein
MSVSWRERVDLRNEFKSFLCVQRGSRKTATSMMNSKKLSIWKWFLSLLLFYFMMALKWEKHWYKFCYYTLMLIIVLRAGSKSVRMNYFGHYCMCYYCMCLCWLVIDLEK